MSLTDCHRRFSKLILPVVSEDFEHYLERWYRDGKSPCAYALDIGLHRAEHRREQEACQLTCHCP